MKIVNEPPSNGIYERAQEKWGVDFYKGVVFTYGDVIYAAESPSGDLVAHEKTHIKQQKKHPGGPKGWWDQYFTDKDFRFSQELEAYRNQYRWIKDNFSDRNQIFSHLLFISKCLSGDMYGNIIPMSKAMRLIKKGVD